MNRNIEITKTIFQPGCSANPGSRFLAEIRSNGWIINREFHDTEPQAQTWLDNTTEVKMSSPIVAAYANMIERWANK